MAKEKNKQDDAVRAKHFPDQLDDEEVEFIFRKHPIVMRKGLVFGMLGPLVGIIPAAVKPELGFGWFFGGLFGGMLLGGLIFLPFWIAWYYSVFIVTDRRLIQITRRGLFRKSFVDMGLNQIQSLNYEVNGLQATMLGYGTLLVQTYMGDLVVQQVYHPAQIYKQLVTVLRDQGVHPANMANQESAEETEKPEAEDDSIVEAEEV